MRCLVRAALVALALASACSDGDGGEGDDGAGLGTTSSIGAPSPPDIPSESPAGTGVVVIGERGAGSSFAVSACELEAAAAGGELLHVTGEGTTGSGVPFRIDVVRRETSGAAETFTDLITYADTARILQVQRFETAGEVSDLRDPQARGTLLRTREGGLSAVGIAGPPGTDVEGPGLVGLALDLTC
jgi:hypothetical protein